MMNTAAPASGPAGGGGLSTPAAPLGNAVLSVIPGLAAQPGAPNPFAGHPYVLLRSSYADAIAKGGVIVPAGVSPYLYVGTACGNRTPDCQKILNTINADAASAVRADANGRGTFPGVAPGVYYLMISTRYNNQPLAWGQAVQLKPGAAATPAELRAFARQRVAAYKYPRHVWFVRELPKGPTGKILHREIQPPQNLLQ